MAGRIPRPTHASKKPLAAGTRSKKTRNPDTDPTQPDEFPDMDVLWSAAAVTPLWLAPLIRLRGVGKPQSQSGVKAAALHMVALLTRERKPIDPPGR